MNLKTWMLFVFFGVTYIALKSLGVGDATGLDPISRDKAMELAVFLFLIIAPVNAILLRLKITCFDTAIAICYSVLLFAIVHHMGDRKLDTINYIISNNKYICSDGLSLVAMSIGASFVIVSLTIKVGGFFKKSYK